MDIVLETQRLILRPPVETDVPVFVPLISDFRVARNLGPTLPHPYTATDGYRWIADSCAKRQAREDFSFAVVLKQTGQYIGVCGVHPSRNFEFGYWIGAPFWGAGYATESSRSVVRFAFDELRPAKLNSRYMDDNHASARVLAKLGFQHTHSGTEFSAVRGQDVLRHCLELTRERFENVSFPP